VSNPFALVAPGAPLQISAEAWNLMLGEAYERAGRQRGPNGGQIKDVRPTPVKILVHNTTGSTLPQWGIVAVGAPTFIPASASESLQPESVHAATAPTAGGLFAVCQQMIPAGSVGFAVVQGVTPCTLNVTATGDTHAGATTSTTELTTGTSGRAEILYKASGTGSGKIGVVLVTNTVASGGSGGSGGLLGYASWHLDDTFTWTSTGTYEKVTTWTGESSTSIQFPSTGIWDIHMRIVSIAGYNSLSLPTSDSGDAYVRVAQVEDVSTILTPDFGTGLILARGGFTNPVGRFQAENTIELLLQVDEAGVEALTLEGYLVAPGSPYFGDIFGHTPGLGEGATYCKATKVSEL